MEIKIFEYLTEITQGYFIARGLVWPDEHDALLFLNSEVGELNDAHVHKRHSWVRNSDRERDPADEAADVLMMLIIYCCRMNINPVLALTEKMKRKLHK